MEWPTWDQVKGIAERFISLGLAALLSWAVIKGWMTKDEAKEWGVEYGPVLLTFAGMAYAYYRNRPKSLAQRTVASIPDTVIVTTAAIARATPESNIVSSATNTVEPKITDPNREELARHTS